MPNQQNKFCLEKFYTVKSAKPSSDKKKDVMINILIQ